MLRLLHCCGQFGDIAELELFCLKRGSDRVCQREPLERVLAVEPTNGSRIVLRSPTATFDPGCRSNHCARQVGLASNSSSQTCDAWSKPRSLNRQEAVISEQSADETGPLLSNAWLCLKEQSWMTFSIVALDSETGELGLGVASRFFAVGAIVPHMRYNAVVATQAFVNPMWGVEGVERLSKGEMADNVMADFLSRDPGHHLRQAHMIDSHGRLFAYTGADCTEWAGHEVAEGISVAGNMLAGSKVVSNALECYLDNLDLPFADRLLVAMEAAEDAGGDKRGRQSAALRTHRHQDYPHYDLRVDDHSDPLAELRRLKSVAEERYIHYAELFGTAEFFPGSLERKDFDRAIADSEAERREKDITSLSAATTPSVP